MKRIKEYKQQQLYKIEWVKEEVISAKPIDIGHGLPYKETLQYLVRTMGQRNPLFKLVLSLASYATANHLSPLQQEKADEIINYFRSKGVF